MDDNVSQQVRDAIADSLATEIADFVVMVALFVQVTGVSVVRNLQQVGRRVFRMGPDAAVSVPGICAVQDVLRFRKLGILICTSEVR